MNVFYTLNGIIYNADDVELALLCAEAASQQNEWTIRALIDTLTNKDVFNGVPSFYLTNDDHFRFNSVSGEITSCNKRES